ncbi:TIGR04219 family outer membrane beta-barrel protein [Acinetobacter haemolyticus]|uniref:TIGR04219 family outer membrane beta-barrel protein n=1 Tax=unclassified Acinetobacter TaxID=196816 RepID=UPI0015D3223B|nr:MULTISPECIES: TIGR04219 family outer membrane beta-barrel protein [unclassified Acinetobacter]MDD2947071.1 TIGR04219 family outer membrane beta-barrel protein [Acinetobacter sp.]UDM38262.1 TIGR04219 family outer membrane beta-barrel protein [Acinetobacter haemolyticus]
MQSLKILCLAIGLGAFSSTQADVIAVKGNIDYWHYSTDVTQPASSLPQTQLEDDHALSFSVAVEHPVPFLPNAKIKHSHLQADSDQSFEGVIKSHQVDLTYTDFILYYEILDNIVDADVGFGAKRLSGDILQNYTDTLDVSSTLPMLYAQAGVNLPFTGLSARVEASFAALNDEQISDAQAELKYNFIDNLLVDVGARVGYRILDIQLEEGSNAETKLKFKGPYLGIEAHF